jgi:hypothetical protein
MKCAAEKNWERIETIWINFKNNSNQMPSQYDTQFTLTRELSGLIVPHISFLHTQFMLLWGKKKLASTTFLVHKMEYFFETRVHKKRVTSVHASIHLQNERKIYSSRLRKLCVMFLCLVCISCIKYFQVPISSTEKKS